MEGDTPHLLPVWQTIIDAYRATFANWRYAIRISWAWLILTFALDALREALTSDQASRSILLWVTVAMLYSIPLSSLAVAWHRKLLREESFDDRVYLRLDLTVWRYFVYVALLDLILAALFVALLIPSLIATQWTPPASIYALFVVPLLLALLAFFRLSTLLPGLALGREHMSFQDAWHRTRGNTLRIFLGTVLCTLGPGLVTLPVEMAVGEIKPSLSLAFVAWAAFDGITSLMVGFFALSFLSFSYRFFFMSEAEATEPPAPPSS